MNILSEMHAINDMDAILRCRIIANYLHTYGNFCCSIKDFVTATNFYKQAICLLKSAYSTTASNYAILAWSTQDLVVAYELSGELELTCFQIYRPPSNFFLQKFVACLKPSRDNHSKVSLFEDDKTYFEVRIKSRSRD